MAELPEQIQDSPTVQAIYAAYNAARVARFSRRLGASIIGIACERAIWYSFRWSGQESFDGRMLRLFETGHREESRVIANLRAIGCEVHDQDPDTKQQIEFTAIDGHVVDKLDGVLVGLPEAPKAWHVCEYKTHSVKSFTDIRNNGLLKSKPQHWAQLMLGMHLSGIERGLYFAVCKDTDALYTERLHYDKSAAEALIAKAERIIKADRAPERINSDRDSFACKFCCHIDRCHGAGPSSGLPVEVNCRTCCHSTAKTDSNSGLGVWRCEKHGKTIGEQDQLRGCVDHLFIPDFITFAEPQDGGNDPEGDWIEYQNSDGTIWRNGRQGSQYRSLELTQLPASLVGAGTIQAAKDHLGGEVVEAIP